jgi:AraC-like DNA-binding protein
MAPVQACADLASFLAAPVGRCFAGSTWLYFYPRDGFCGAILWDRPSREDFERLIVLFKNELTRVQHVSMIDARRVTEPDPRAFGVLSAYVSAHQAELARAVRKLAVVRPGGLVGAVTAGFFGVVAQPYPVELFDDRAQALRWLGTEDAAGELEREEARAFGAPALLRDLRAFLEARLEDASLENAAKTLGTSARSLQRKLGEHETTFQAEMNAARVRVAKRLLVETDTKLSQVALEVGCASLASFSGLFRRATGETPSAFRDRHRKST